VLHEHFLGRNLRTEDPEQAQLFMIPVYLGRYYNWFWQQWSTPGNPWEIVQECEPRHRAGSPECWWEKWMWAKGVRIAYNAMAYLAYCLDFYSALNRVHLQVWHGR
jgi:hypothetical protein